MEKRQRGVRRNGTFAKRAASSSKLSKQIGWLNNNADLLAPITFTEVKDVLTELGENQAMKLLKHLEEKASEVRDPTAYLVTAARRGLERSKQEPRQRTRRQQQDAGDEIQEGEAIEVDAEENVESSDKTGTSKAGRRSGNRATGQAKRVLKTKLKEKHSKVEDESLEKVRKRISWLNDKAGLQKQLDFEQVGQLLLDSGPYGEVMKILKNLEEQAAKVRNPNGFIINAAKRLATEGIAPEPQSSATARDFTNETLETQLKAHIDWMNKQVGLHAPILFEEVAPHLLHLEPENAGEILRRLEESASEVRNPNGYIIAAVKKLPLPNGGGAKRAEAFEPEPPPPVPRQRSAGNADAEKLQRRLVWLNQHIQLPSALDFDRVGPHLLSLGYHMALEVLNNLEENASTVRDPNAWLIAGARKMAEGSSAPPASRAPVTSRGSRQAPPALPAPPAVPAGEGVSEERLQKRLEWLNSNVCRDKPLELARVSPTLLQLPSAQAFEVLKFFEENAQEVNDPNGYVISNARRVKSGRTLRPQNASRESSRAPSSRREAPAAVMPAPPDPRRERSRPTSVDVRPLPKSRSDLPKSTGSRQPIGAPIGAMSRPQQSESKAKGRDDDLEGKIRRKITWLNHNAGLQVTLDSSKVSRQLVNVGHDEAFEVLRRLQESSDSVRDSNGYVISACRRVMDKGPQGRRR